MLSALVLALPAVSMAQARSDTGWFTSNSAAKE